MESIGKTEQETEDALDGLAEHLEATSLDSRHTEYEVPRVLIGQTVQAIDFCLHQIETFTQLHGLNTHNDTQEEAATQEEESQPKEMPPEKSQPKEFQPQDACLDDSQPKEFQPEDPYMVDSQPTEIQPEYAYLEESQPPKFQPEDAYLESQRMEITPEDLRGKEDESKPTRIQPEVIEVELDLPPEGFQPAKEMQSKGNDESSRPAEEIPEDPKKPGNPHENCVLIGGTWVSRDNAVVLLDEILAKEDQESLKNRDLKGASAEEIQTFVASIYRVLERHRLGINMPSSEEEETTQLAKNVEKLDLTSPAEEPDRPDSQGEKAKEHYTSLKPKQKNTMQKETAGTSEPPRGRGRKRSAPTSTEPRPMAKAKDESKTSKGQKTEHKVKEVKAKKETKAKIAKGKGPKTPDNKTHMSDKEMKKKLHSVPWL